MIHTVKTVLLLVGLGASCAAVPASQPEAQVTPAPLVYSNGRSYLGVDIRDVTAERVGPLKLKEERGVEVTMVDQDAPAGKAGLKEHDVILDFNGTAVEGEEQLRRLLRETPPGRTVTLGISRDGSPTKVSLQLADRGKLAPEPGPKVFSIPRMPETPSYAVQIQQYSPSLGIQTENLTQQLAEFFGVKGGVLVRSVERGSAAGKAGVKAGDVIVRADNETLSDRADLSHILRNHREGGKVSLGIVRDKREQTIVVDLPRRGPNDSWFVWPDSDWPNSEQFKHNIDEWQKEFRELIDEVKPETQHLRETTQVNARLALEQARRQMKEVRPQLDQTLRRTQKLLEHQQRELRRRVDTMI